MRYSVPLLCSTLLLFAGCSVHVDITAEKNGGADFRFRSSMGSAIEKTIRAVAGSDRTGPLFSTDEIRQQLTDSGLKNVSAAAADTVSLDIRAYSDKLSEGIAAVPDALTYSVQASGTHTLVCTLSPQILQQAVSLLPDKEKNYIDLLMAPVFTGDVMTESDYLELIASVYGQPIADELKNSSLIIELHGPAVSGKSEKKSIPLTKLLTLSDSRITETLVW